MADIKADMARQHATLQVRNSVDTVLQQSQTCVGLLVLYRTVIMYDSTAAVAAILQQ